ncbi:lipocalin-like domain-containing protein [Raineyella sp.]|uniref:Lipocalin-like domain-containing protein n=1 Tax=bioreactor metagenome TaxID=1076179 RepID=A0A644Y3L6_9ZZZZ|nr:lipocalin-like domain-containing protein [Raineyella sp.]MEA5153481.1 lipocalin-like domain-containing protein [Raineyella sp.]
MAATTITPEEFERTWRLVDWRQEYDDGRVKHPMGEGPIGLIAYRDGRMYEIATSAGRANFVTGGQWDADEAERAMAYSTSMCYAGTYTLEGDQVTHHVDLSVFPNFVGKSLRRTVGWDGQTMTLSGRMEEGTSEARTVILDWRPW